MKRIERYKDAYEMIEEIKKREDQKANETYEQVQAYLDVYSKKSDYWLENLKALRNIGTEEALDLYTKYLKYYFYGDVLSLVLSNYKNKALYNEPR